jgi:tetratricopeptide (TPR) repeat protein
LFRKEITHLEAEGVSDTAERDALALLNDSKYKKILARSPESEALINHILGDIYYTEGDYVSAVTSYRKALERAKAAKVNLTDYYRDLGLALSYADRLEEAKAVLGEAEANGAANASQQLIRAVICYKERDYAGCIEIANALMSEPAGNEAKARAAIAAARAEGACENYEEEIGWLKTAGNYSSSSVILEEQGRAYMDLVRTAPEATKRSYAELAADCYERLNANRYVSMENRLNLALVYRILEKYNDSINVLEKCLEDEPENLVAHMYLAFDYDAIEKGSKARIHVQEAWRIYEKNAVSSQNQPVDEGALEELKILLRKYTM